MSNTYLILDCDYLCYRIRYAMGGSLTYGGVPTEVIFVFIKEVAALQEQFRTNKIIFCWDSKVSLRKAIYPEYKAGRHKADKAPEELAMDVALKVQMNMLRKHYLPQIGYRNNLWAKGYEADDHIASAAMAFGLDEDTAIVIASDHDLYQCITHSVSCYNPQTHKHLTVQGFRTTYGIVPKQWANVKALAGCHSDNIKGIPGVGEKTAIKYVRAELKVGSRAWSAINSKEGQAIVERNWQLVCLPFEGTPTPVFKTDELSIENWRKLCNELGFKSMTKGFNPFPVMREQRRHK